VKFRSDPASIRGSLVALITPFDTNGEVDHTSLRDLVRWQLDCGSHGISIGGSTGEPGAQTTAERIAAFSVVAEEVADRVPFLAGTGSLKLDDTLALTSAAYEIGADAALVVTRGPRVLRRQDQWLVIVSGSCSTSMTRSS
jgi:4-hydroxy-tetrahydrodipicolinate synthase